MIINTKYDIEEHVWMMRDNKPLEFIVVCVMPADYIKNSETNQVCRLGEHRYNIQLTKDGMELAKVGDVYSFEVRETDIYPSKRALLESFLDEND